MIARILYYNTLEGATHDKLPYRCLQQGVFLHVSVISLKIKYNKFIVYSSPINIV